MSAAHHQLLDGVIQHLQDLKSRGVRFISVSPETLAALRPSQGKGPAPSKSSSASSLRKSPERIAAESFPSITAPSPPRTVSVSAPSFALQPPGLTPAASILGPEARSAAFSELRQRALVCAKCAHLASSRKNVVFGVGNENADLMFVGEAPGADEDAQGEPFVGKAGELLTRIIQTMGLTRGAVYIANILKCRPDTPGQTAGNRKPTPEEMRTCIPFLHEQIDLIRPKVIVALGGTAVEGLLGKTVGIMRLRGQWQVYRETPLMPTYHPAYLLRNQALSEKRRVWEDMLQVMEKLGMAISEKQRNYFLKPGA